MSSLLYQNNQLSAKTAALESRLTLHRKVATHKFGTNGLITNTTKCILGTPPYSGGYSQPFFSDTDQCAFLSGQDIGNFNLKAKSLLWIQHE